MKPINTFLFFFVVLLSVFLYKSKGEIVEGLSNLWPDNEVIVSDDSITSKKVIDTISFKSEPISEIHQQDSLVQLSRIDTIGFLYDGTNLNTFNRKLKETSDTLVRVLYIGDSQLEGDHITYSLRKKLQDKFGGGGVGYLQLKTLYNSGAGLTIITNDFGEEAIFKRSKPNSKYGIFGKWYTPLEEQSEVLLKLKSKAQNFGLLQLYYTGSAQLDVTDENKQTIQLNDNFKQIKFTPSRENRLIFSKDVNFRIYGFMLDAEKGIAVDNVPFRGVMNPNYYLQDVAFLKQMNKQLNVGLIILHYGVNVVHDIRESYSNYQIAMNKDVQLLKKAFPESSIMIVSTSDMAHKVDGEMISYENIEHVLKVQREVSIDNEIAYWDLYNAMGGEGSMLKWHDKKWARPDYVHLSKEGTDYIGDLMARDIISNFNRNSKN